MLEHHGIVERDGALAYRLTEAGAGARGGDRRARPLGRALSGAWPPEHYDAGPVLWNFCKHVAPDELPDDRLVFASTSRTTAATGCCSSRPAPEICFKPPGYDEDLVLVHDLGVADQVAHRPALARRRAARRPDGAAGARCTSSGCWPRWAAAAQSSRPPRLPETGHLPSRPRGKRLRRVDDAVFIGGPEKRAIVIEDYDPAWAARFEQVQAALNAGAAAQAARRIEHFGSTAVPGLGAKGIIDVLVTVEDADDEASLRPRARARTASPSASASPGTGCTARPTRTSTSTSSPTPARRARIRLLFRDWLRHDDADRRLYEETKRELARRDWEATNDYSDAKGAVVAEILVRAQRWSDAGPA